ncbi:MAG TPA: acyl-CoA dehydrogenase family protein [Candidatus Limnocylindrales bacterium]
MDLTDTPELAEYRRTVRQWLEANKSHAPKEKTALHVHDIEPLRAWQRRLAGAGLVGVTWPQEHGGRGGTMLEQAVVNSELDRAGVPGALDIIGVGNLGPTVIAHGTRAQKERHLRPLLLGEEIWCQLFSEPAAGSDLAGIRTRAVRAEGGWRLNGQKVWTTNAQHAAFGLLLARTDVDVPKHKGLTMFIVPMRAPGVTIRPLRQLTGVAAFNEVFFDGVALGEDALLGEVGEGWTVAMTCLMYERFNLLTMLDQLGWQPEQFVRPIRDRLERADLRQRLAGAIVDMLAVRYTGYRALSKVAQGGLPGPEAGLGKITLVDAVTRGSQVVAEALGPSALDGDWGFLLAEMQGLRSGGGTDEIVLTTIGERVLGLPAEPRVDKTQPFRELPA